MAEEGPGGMPSVRDGQGVRKSLSSPPFWSIHKRGRNAHMYRWDMATPREIALSLRAGTIAGFSWPDSSKALSTASIRPWKVDIETGWALLGGPVCECETDTLGLAYSYPYGETATDLRVWSSFCYVRVRNGSGFICFSVGTGWRDRVAGCIGRGKRRHTPS